jgi:DNA-binding beta-propeller fold protein YncE
MIAALLPTPADAFKLAYAYNLSTPTGALKTSSVVLSFDRQTRETYVIGYGQVRIFNEAGMEVFSFGDDASLGAVYGLAALEGGDFVLLSYEGGKASLIRTNFRGEPIGRIEPTGVPEAFAAEFRPNRLGHHDGKIFLVDEASMKLLVTTDGGSHVASYDLAALLGVSEKRRELGINGASIDAQGRFLFTVAPLFKVHILSPDGKLQAFGQSGGAPGKFNVVAGVGADDDGRIYVVDSLKCAVLVFDKSLRFLGEYGYRGHKPGELIFPTNVAVGGGKVYVAQSGNRGISVYRILPE